MSSLPLTPAMSDADFVRDASAHRDMRLASASFYSKGPNTLMPGDTVYLFTCPPEGEYRRLLAVSVPDGWVIARDADRVRRTFLERDAACTAGGPWWMKPLGAG